MDGTKTPLYTLPSRDDPSKKNRFELTDKSGCAVKRAREGNVNMMTHVHGDWTIMCRDPGRSPVPVIRPLHRLLLWRNDAQRLEQEGTIGWRFAGLFEN